MRDNHGLRTLAEIDAAPPQPAPPPTTRLIALGVICLLSAGAVMVLWSITLGFVLAIVAALVIAGAAWGEG